MFVAALFAVAKTWVQPKCALTEKWIKTIWYLYSMECNSDIMRNNIVPFAEISMNLEAVIQNEASQIEKSRHCIISLIHGF